MKLTKSQGRACLKAMEKIERGLGGTADATYFDSIGLDVEDALIEIGWCNQMIGAPNTFRDYIRHGRYCYNRRQVATALAMCVTLSGIELRYE